MLGLPLLLPVSSASMNITLRPSAPQYAAACARCTSASSTSSPVWALVHRQPGCLRAPLRLPETRGMPRRAGRPTAAVQDVESSGTRLVHSEDELNSVLKSQSGKLVVAMCKSTHCKPCKVFLPQYVQLAERFSDFVMLEVVGDENPELRNIMKTWKIKTTPTFVMFRNGVEVHRVSGTRDNKVLDALLSQLKDGEAGQDWSEVTQEEFLP